MVLKYTLAMMERIISVSKKTPVFLIEEAINFPDIKFIVTKVSKNYQNSHLIFKIGQKTIVFMGFVDNWT